MQFFLYQPGGVSNLIYDSDVDSTKVLEEEERYPRIGEHVGQPYLWQKISLRMKDGQQIVGERTLALTSFQFAGGGSTFPAEKK